MTHAEQFLRHLLTDDSMQQAITSLNFTHLQTVASQYGFTLHAGELDDVLTQHPDLAEQVQELIDASDLEFELNEAELALIAGGSFVGPSPSTLPPPDSVPTGFLPGKYV